MSDKIALDFRELKDNTDFSKSEKLLQASICFSFLKVFQQFGGFHGFVGPPSSRAAFASQSVPSQQSNASSSDSFAHRRCFPTAPSSCPFSLPSPLDCNLALKWILAARSFGSGDIVASYPSGGGILPAQLPSFMSAVIF